MVCPSDTVPVPTGNTQKQSHHSKVMDQERKPINLVVRSDSVSTLECMHAREIVQRSRALATLVKNFSSVPRKHTNGSRLSATPVLGD